MGGSVMQRQSADDSGVVEHFQKGLGILVRDWHV
jgi:hypothetical protein